MVKISELSDKQLLSQIAKYEKILSGLTKERDKRSAAKKQSAAAAQSHPEESEKTITASETDLDLSQPATKNEPVSHKKSSTETGFKFDVSEIARIQKEEESDDDNDEAEEEVQVTTLLKFSKEKLEELKSASSKAVNKKKKK